MVDLAHLVAIDRLGKGFVKDEGWNSLGLTERNGVVPPEIAQVDVAIIALYGRDPAKLPAPDNVFHFPHQADLGAIQEDLVPAAVSANHRGRQVDVPH